MDGLTVRRNCVTLCHMTPIKNISIRDLHARTGALVREAAAGAYAFVVTDRGRPVATISPFVESEPRRSFRDRRILPTFAKIERRGLTGDSTKGISADRERY